MESIFLEDGKLRQVVWDWRMKLLLIVCDRGQYYDKVEHNMDVPQYVLQNSDRFRYLLDRDGEDAAFADYWSQI